MLNKMFVPLRPSTKHNELSQQAPLPRGAAAKDAMVSKHDSAEERYMTTLTSKIGHAAAHNEKVGHVAAGSRMADVLVYNERKLNFDRNMDDHNTRHEAAIKAKARKGTQEVNKVAAAVAALQRLAAWAGSGPSVRKKNRCAPRGGVYHGQQRAAAPWEPSKEERSEPLKLS